MSVVHTCSFSEIVVVFLGEFPYYRIGKKMQRSFPVCLVGDLFLERAPYLGMLWRVSQAALVLLRSLWFYLACSHIICGLVTSDKMRCLLQTLTLQASAWGLSKPPLVNLNILSRSELYRRFLERYVGSCLKSCVIFFCKSSQSLCPACAFSLGAWQKAILVKALPLY